MVTRDDIQKLSDAIAAEFAPEQILLFGSYAYGSPTPDSDVDLLVVLPHTGEASRIAAAILTRLRPAFPVDILVRSPDRIKERLRLNDYFIREIVDRGKILYAAPHG